MPDRLFNDKMTGNEARLKLFLAVEGESMAEIEKIKSEYLNVLPSIIEREHKMASEGWMFG